MAFPSPSLLGDPSQPPPSMTQGGTANDPRWGTIWPSPPAGRGQSETRGYPTPGTGGLPFGSGLHDDFGPGGNLAPRVSPGGPLGPWAPLTNPLPSQFNPMMLQALLRAAGGSRSPGGFGSFGGSGSSMGSSGLSPQLLALLHRYFSGGR